MNRLYLVRHLEAVLLIAVGGVAGSNLRYIAGAVSGDALFGTLVVNAVGSFALGLLLFDARADDLLSKRFRYIFGAGFLASFTTYSTFIADAALSSPAIAVIYIVASYTAGFIGVLISREIVSRASQSDIRAPTPGDE